MYTTLRTIKCAPGRVADAVGIATKTTELLNERHGGSYSVSVQVGGDPDVMGASSAWETLGAYQAAREGYLADEETMALLAEASEVMVSATDEIANVLVPAGERTAFTALNRARMIMPRIADAIPFGLEVAEFVEGRIGVKTGFAVAVTGNRSKVGWFAHYDSLDHMATTGETLEADPEYLDLFKRSADLFVDGSLEQTIWNRVS